ncbi:hypothetical protein [Bradyrhizobium sp. ARR65]|uniref:hypothetical protein n=1 Tax=Bradyrhizobium sp. ARR65 TaxID=1040989 RepID=UPI00046444CE|nr:hypothetical protein [Bradyrhizobium sp. ARR65]
MRTRVALLVLALLWTGQASRAEDSGPNPTNYKIAGAWYSVAKGDAGRVRCGPVNYSAAKALLYTSPNASEFPIINVYDAENRVIGSISFGRIPDAVCAFDKMFFKPGGG